MDLRKLISEEDKELLSEYITSYASIKPISINNVLSEWDKNKKKLYKLLGRQLRIKCDIDFDNNSSILLNSDFPALYEELDMLSFNLHKLERFIDTTNSIFIKNLYKYMASLIKEKIIPNDTFLHFNKYFKHMVVIKGYTAADYTFQYKGKKDLCIPAHTKIMRAIRKMLEYIEYPCMNYFTSWRDEVSVLLSTDTKNAKLVFSIHPVDFFTLSDNNSSWSSCLSWNNRGTYRQGCIEMLNSNMAIVVYIENNNRKYYFNSKEIPNKAWRSLFFIHEKILIAGKPYPFKNNDITYFALDKLMELAKKNLKYTYKYQYQPLRDMYRVNDNTAVKFKKNRNHLIDYSGHKIFTYMNKYMFNDFIEGSYEPLCCRNYVEKSLFLNLSGKMICLSCGKPISDDGHLSDCGFCRECYENHYCDCCHILDASISHTRLESIILSEPGTNNICHRCSSEFVYSKSHHCYIHKDILSHHRKIRKE